MPRTTIRQTPGVYVTELDAFPPSIVGVQTAIPAFIGYTEKAEISGKAVFRQAIKINSLVEFETVFGRGYKPLYNIEEVTDLTEVSAGHYDLSVLSYSEGPYSPAAPPTAEGQKYYNLDQDGDTKFALYDSMRLFFANGGGTCYVVSVGSYAQPNGDARTVTTDDLIKGLEVTMEQSGPTMLAMPDATLLATNDDFKKVLIPMIEQAEALQDRVAILDVFGTETIDGSSVTLDTIVSQFRTDLAALNTRQLSYGVAYIPFLRTTVWSPDEVDYTNIVTGEDGQDVLTKILGWQNVSLNWDFSQQQPTQRYTDVQADIDSIPTTTGEHDITALNQNLTAALPVMADIDRVVMVKNEVSPSSGAMAGIYTANDQNNGVWNAPANVSLRSVKGVTLRIDNDSQADLNMPVNGMAIDAIRDFQNRGQVVWGARTLDGNSPDFRYVQVRRTLIYIEQSIKAALDPFVFAANDGKTWVAVTSMVSGFLQGLWNQGGLMGATASEAFSVECGLGSTMTGQDILDGYMIVNVTLQMIRPAEFIELTFKQKMEGVA